jgi:hypothetical protein
MRKEETALRFLWTVLLAVPATTLSAGDRAPQQTAVARIERGPGWRPVITDPTLPLVRLKPGPYASEPRRDSELRQRSYRFGDGAYLRFHDYIQDAGDLERARGGCACCTAAASERRPWRCAPLMPNEATR